MRENRTHGSFEDSSFSRKDAKTKRGTPVRREPCAKTAEMGEGSGLKKGLAAPDQPVRRSVSSLFNATDRQIDQLVCGLYELSDEEIRIVEEATSR